MSADLPSTRAPRSTAGGRGRSLRADVALTTGTDLAVSVVGMAASLVSARLLLAQGRGELAAIVTFPTLLGTLATLGLPDALVYFGARRSDRAGRQLGTAMVLALCGSAAFAGVGWFLVPVVLREQSPEVVEAARWYLLSVPVVAVGTSLIPQPLRGVGDPVWWNAVRAAPFVSWLAVLVGAAASGTEDPGTIALWFLVARVALIPPSLAVVRWRLRQAPRLDRSLVGPMLRYGLPLTVAVVPRVINLRLDQLLIPAFLDAEQLGLYVVGIGWSNVVLPFQRGLGAVFFPRVAGGEGEAAHRTFAQGSRIGLLTALVLVVLALTVTPLAIPLLFGSAFADSVPVALLLVCSAMPSGWNWVLTSGLRGLGGSRAVMWAELAGMVVTLVLLPPLLTVAGIEGAAVASIAGYSTVTVAMVVQARRITGASLADLALPRRDDLVLLRRQMRRGSREDTGDGGGVAR